jgi:CBS domain-containing protein
MATVYDLVKNREIYQASETQTVLEVARSMVERNIGAVPVCREGELVGIFSERDLMRRVLVEGLDPAKTRIANVMSRELHMVAPGDSVEHCMVVMRDNGIRHLPICEGRRLKGFLSLRDLLLHEVEEQEVDLNMMRAYIRNAG